MAEDTSIREKLLSLLAHQPRHIMTGQIKIASPATPSTIRRNPDPTAFLGRLDKLPLELLHFIFSKLDLKTLANITRTCLRGLAVVEWLPEFRDLLRHAPSAMKALGATQLIRHHSAHALHTALCESKCVSCGEFGAFLFLPTCERCCYGCLWSNQSLWVMPISQARTIFDLSTRSVKKLPVMRNLPGEYWVRWTVSRKRSNCLVSVKQAKQLALGEGKTVDRLLQILDDRREQGDIAVAGDWSLLRFLARAPLEAPGPSLAKLRLGVPYIPNDRFCGMASIQFPSLRIPNDIDSGLWCLGCEKVEREWHHTKQYEIADPYEAVGYEPGKVFQEMIHMARSDADFFEHITQCEGAMEIIDKSDLGEELSEMLAA